MKVAWVHSMRFLQRGDRYFGEAQITHKIWQRYLAHFNSLLVIAREAERDPRAHGKYITDSSGPGVEFRLQNSINSLAEIVTSRARVRAEMREHLSTVDGVIARLPSEHGLLAVSVAEELRKPCAIELVGCAQDALWHHGDLRGKLYAPVMAHRVRQAVKRAQFVLYVTREYLQQRYPASFERTEVSNVELPVSVAAISDVDLISSAGMEGKTAKRETSDFVLGLAGAFQNKYKGHETAFRALREIVSTNANVKLHLIGVGDDSPWRRMAEQLGVSRYVSFDGILPPGPSVHSWMKRLDLYIQPSLTEGLPRALIEAMSNGRAALASRVGGIPELLGDDCLHAPGDWRELARKIEFARAHPDWRRKQSKANRKRSEQYFAPVLDAKRSEFWESFARHCMRHALEKAS